MKDSTEPEKIIRREWAGQTDEYIFITADGRCWRKYRGQHIGTGDIIKTLKG